MKDVIHSLIIIGSGPAGLTAALYAGRANLKPVVIEGTLPGGQLINTSYVENWPGDKSILGYDLMMRMKNHAAEYPMTFVPEIVEKVDFTSQPFAVTTHKKNTFKARAIIIATGATPKRLGCPGEDEYWGKGVTTCAVCDGALYKDKRVLIVGGGDSAMEDASFMTNFTDQIYIVQILDTLSASVAMQARVLGDPRIKIMYNTTVTKMMGNGNHVTGVQLTNVNDNSTQELEFDAVFVAIGLSPNTKPFAGQLDLTSYGHIQVHDHTKSSVPGVFIAGDVADDRYRQAITAAGAGCMAALDAERFLNKL